MRVNLKIKQIELIYKIFQPSSTTHFGDDDEEQTAGEIYRYFAKLSKTRQLARDLISCTSSSLAEIAAILSLTPLELQAILKEKD